MALILCGLACAGKTTLGQLCAEELSLPFYDIDRIIEASYTDKLTVSDIWREVGEERFREYEREVIVSIKRESSIIALGGGSLLCEKNRKHLKQFGVSIYLKTSVHLLYERVLKRGFPAYLDKSNPYAHFEAIALERSLIYESHCDHIVECETFTERQLVEKILSIGRGEVSGWE